MAKIGRQRAARLVFLICGLLAAGAASFDSSVADAGPLEGLPGPVREATERVEEVANGVVPPVPEATETVPPPVAEVVETATPPVAQITEATVPPAVGTTEAVAPPAKGAAEAAAQATKEVIARLPSAPVTTPTKLPSVTDGDPAEGAKTVVHGAEGTLGSATGAVRDSGSPVRASRSPAGGGAVATYAPDTRPAPGSSAPSRSGSPSPTAKVPGNGLGDADFKPPSTDGSIRAPLTRWMAYVWPAIALLGPDIAGFVERWERNGARLLLTADAGPSGDQGVAGVHASHDSPAAGSSSSSPFSSIPSAIGGFTSEVPDEALAYLAIVAILVAAVFAAVKLELARSRRQG
jgi:hypothetical protein